MTEKEWLEKHDYNSLEEAENEGCIHISKTEKEMKIWFLEDMSLSEVIDTIEGNIQSGYGTWDYLEDINKYVYIY